MSVLIHFFTICSYIFTKIIFIKIINLEKVRDSTVGNSWLIQGTFKKVNVILNFLKVVYVNVGQKMVKEVFEETLS